MRRVCACALLIAVSGCATTVHRLDGEFPTPAGLAKTDCEKREWLVVSPTRAEFVDKHGVRSETRDDGVALYHIGQSGPVSIPSIAHELGGGARFEQHEEAVKSHDTKQLVAGGLGVAGAIAVAVGTILFVNAFGTERGSDGSEHQKVDGGRLAAGGLTVGVGFGLGIGGIALNPGQAERSRAEAARYVFFPPEERRDDVVELTGRYNQAVRDRCERRATP
jgi:hypothetical protein